MKQFSYSYCTTQWWPAGSAELWDSFLGFQHYSIANVSLRALSHDDHYEYILESEGARKYDFSLQQEGNKIKVFRYMQKRSWWDSIWSADADKAKIKTITLPADAQPETVRARFRNGKLYIYADKINTSHIVDVEYAEAEEAEEPHSWLEKIGAKLKSVFS